MSESLNAIMTRISEGRSVRPITLANYRRNILKMSHDVMKLKDDEKYDVCKRCCKGEVKEEEFKDLEFLKNYDDMVGYMNKLTPSVRKLRCASVIVALEDEGLKEKYRKYMFEEKRKYDENMKKNKKNEKQSDQWVKFEELVKCHKNYRTSLKNEGLLKKEKQVLDSRQKNMLMKFLVSGLYTMVSPGRNDYSNMKVINYEGFEELTDEDKDNNKYAVLGVGKNMSYFHLGKNTYKTGKTMGNHKLKAGRQLQAVLKIWRHYNKDAEYLLSVQRGKNKGNPMTSNSLTKYIMKTFEPTGKKKIGSNMIRHIFVSENDDIKAVKNATKIAKDMKHSVGQQQTTYLKDDKYILNQLG